jgi:hypothetical protein
LLVSRQETIIAALLLSAVLVGGIVRLIRRHDSGASIASDAAPLRSAEAVSSP